MRSKCVSILRKLTGKKNIVFTKRGNEAILKCLMAAKARGRTRILLQDQGGWITYMQYAKKLKFEIKEIKTDYGLVIIGLFTPYLNDCSVFLINSYPGYISRQMHMGMIYGFCRESKTILINDVSGSIGTKSSLYGDLILGSFGKWKPVDVEYGGFIAYNDEYSFTEGKLDDFFPLLYTKLKGLNKKFKKYEQLHEKIVHDLKYSDVVHPDLPGINVAVKYMDNAEKQRITGYCQKNKLEFTECPRYIRILDNAISIEVKRK